MTHLLYKPGSLGLALMWFCQDCSCAAWAYAAERTS